MTERHSQFNSDGYNLISLEQLLAVLDQETNRPVLLACLHEGEEWRQLTDELQTIAEGFAGRLLVVVVNCSQETEAPERLGLLGTPTYVLYAAGREVGRLIGRADLLSLRALVRSVLAASEPEIRSRRVSL